MALMNCGDCNALVSSSAASCPRCNAPPSQFRVNSVRRARPVLIALGSAIAGSALTILILLLASRAPSDMRASASLEPDTQTPMADRSMPSRPNFVAQRNGEYGYQLKSGRDASDLTFIRYLGTTGNVIRFAEVQADKTVLFTCEGMCDQVVATVYMGGRESGRQAIVVDGGSLLYAIIEDIGQGRIKPYRAPPA